MKSYPEEEAMTLTLEALEAVAREGVEMNGTLFRHPEDDWVPAALVDCPAGLQIVGLGVIDRDSVERVFAGLGQFVASVRASAVAVVVPTGTGPAVLVPADGERSRAVMVVGIDPGAIRVRVATVARDGKRPPRLAGWGAAEDVDGSWMTALQHTLQAAVQ